MSRINIFALVTIFIIAFGFILNVRSNAADNFCLSKSYEYYKSNFMTKDGRIIDFEREDVTTSEGQSYMLLRSLLMDDKKTFDLVYKWTKDNLETKGKVFAWLWGKNLEGQYKVLDDNSASDADIDIAFALLLAHEKWDKYEYLSEALPIINAIWNSETKQIGNHLVLMPGYKQTFAEKIEINPSYFSPYAFRFFQKYDELHDWDMLIESSYYYLEKASEKTATGLFPNWFFVENGQIILENSDRSDFSYDAIRIFPRIFVDYKNTGEKRAQALLDKSNFFVKKWQAEKEFYTNYQADGRLRDKHKYMGSIAVLLPVIDICNEKVAEEIYSKELEPYVQNAENWKNQKDYYGKNLIWFGLYLYEKKLKGCDIKD